MQPIKLHAAVGVLAIVVSLTGCGPLHMPMVVRLEPDQQRAIDQTWNDALSPVDRLDDQALLDAMLVTEAYQVGVDRLTMRSEKQTNAGLVVMEIYFDRLQPHTDRFVITIYDPNGREIRRAQYFSEQVHRTYGDLFIESERLKRTGDLTEDERLRQDELQQRVAAAQALIPQCRNVGGRAEECPVPKKLRSSHGE